MSAREGLRAHLLQNRPIPLDAELACAPGEVLALVGPSGSGKSTVLHCLAGLKRAAHGRVAVDGREWFDAARRIDLPPHRRRVGLVFQSYALFPHMTVLANVTAALGHRARHERETVARRLLGLVHLEGLEARRPAQLSGGQQQRVAVARALAREPSLLLLDEPFSAVDKVTRQKLYRELAELRRELSMPVVLVTHDLDEAAMLADRMSILHHGRTLQAGTPTEIMTRPSSVEVARLVDLKNIYEGAVAEHRPEAGLTLVAWRGRLLEARHQPAFAPGQPITWLVPEGFLVMHRRDRPSRGERENPVQGTVEELLVLGETASLRILLEGGGDRLWMNVPSHVARRNALTLGASVTVSLLAEGIHLMPPAGGSP